MTKHYTTTLSLSVGGDEPTWEGEVTVCYTVTWGAPERGPTYNCGGTPADPDEVNDITITHIDGAVVVGRGLMSDAETLEGHIEGDDALLAELLSIAAAEEADDHADAIERRWSDDR